MNELKVFQARRILEKRAHQIGCQKDQFEVTVYGVMAGGAPYDQKVKHDGSCTCGLDEVINLLREA